MFVIYVAMINLLCLRNLAIMSNDGVMEGLRDHAEPWMEVSRLPAC